MAHRGVEAGGSWAPCGLGGSAALAGAARTWGRGPLSSPSPDCSALSQGLHTEQRAFHVGHDACAVQKPSAVPCLGLNRKEASVKTRVCFVSALRSNAFLREGRFITALAALSWRAGGALCNEWHFSGRSSKARLLNSTTSAGIPTGDWDSWKQKAVRAPAHRSALPLLPPQETVDEMAAREGALGEGLPQLLAASC